MFCRKTILAALLVSSLFLKAEEAATSASDAEEVSALDETRPTGEEEIKPSDAASLRLLKNYATVIGAASAPELRNIRASGIFTYAQETKKFELVETADGARSLTLEWRSLGRVYREQMKSLPGAGEEGRDVVSREISKEVIGPGGERTLERVFLELRVGSKLVYRSRFGSTAVSGGVSVRAKPLTSQQKAVIAGGYGEVSTDHFRDVFLLRQPVFDAGEREMGYRYAGSENRFERPVYIVRHASGRVFYFDREKFLLVQWGGKSQVGGKTLRVDYRSSAFKRQDNILLPSKVLLTAERAVLGSYSIDQVEVDAAIDPDLWKVPEY